MAEFTKSYKAKGVLSTVDGTLTETKKEGIFTHDFVSAFKKFEGQDVTITISLKKEVEPVEAEATGE
jgi:hypothetical protein